MDRVLASEKHKITGLYIQYLRRDLTVEKIGDTGVIVLSGRVVPEPPNVFEACPTSWLLNEQGDREGRIVEVPSKLLTSIGIVDVDRGQWIGIGIKALLPGHSADPIPEGLGVIEGPQGRIGGDHIVANAAF